MKLIGIKFNRYKTIKDNELDIEGDLTCLVGVNESGKSNVLSGIAACDASYTLSEVDISRHDASYLLDGSTPSLDLRFIPSSGEEKREIEKLLGSNADLVKINKTGGLYRLDYPEISPEKSIHFETVISKRVAKAVSAMNPEILSDPTPEVPIVDIQTGQSVSPKSEQELTEMESKEARDLITKDLLKYLPNFKYFDSVKLEDNYLPETGDVSIESLVSAPETNLPVINLLKLAGITPDQLTKYSTPQDRIRRSTRLDTGSTKLNKELLSDFWPIEKVGIALGAEGDILKIRLKDGKEFAPGERSRGLQWALAFNIFFLSATEGINKNTVLLLDEPGIFLHIDAQKKMLKSTFRNIIKLGNQIIYSTHLPYLIDKDFPEKIRILEKGVDGSTIIGNKAWSQSEFGSIPEPIRTALGINLIDIIFGDVNLVVEGPSDQIYLRDILDKYHPDIADAITIVPAYGVEKIPGVVALAILSDKKVLGIADGDKDLVSLKEKLSSVGIDDGYITNITAISESGGYVTSEDIIPEDIFYNAVCKVYEHEFTKRRRKFNKDDIPKNMPRVENLERYMRATLKSSKHKIPKMDISRIISDDIVNNRTQKVSIKSWQIAKKNADFIKKWFEVKSRNGSDLKKETNTLA